MKTKKIIFERIIPILTIAIFIVRMFCYRSQIDNISNEIGSVFYGLNESLNSVLNNKILTLFTLLIIWFQYTFIILVPMRSFFKCKQLNNLVSFVAPVVFILNLIFVGFSTRLFLGLGEGNFLVEYTGILPILDSEIPTVLLEARLLFSLLIVESVLGLVQSIYFLVSTNFKAIKIREILIMFGILLLVLIPTLPGYFVQSVFGVSKATILPKGVSFSHRILIYLAIIIPVVLYFSLRNQSDETIRFTLTYICLGVLVGFLVNYDYTTFSRPWDWPFHLCNTALFILPICLIFKTKRLFYFTYFINVLGALLAMLMPNYADLTRINEMRIFTFWFNHWVAFFMPLLLVALRVFEKPKIKQFIYSMTWFLGYFILVLILNVVFTQMGKDVDYFFINTDFVGEKLGLWAEKLFDITANITIKGKIYTFHPVYQSLFFVVYIILGLAVWFVYSEFFRIADSHNKLNKKYKEIKIHEYAYNSSLSREQKEEMMKESKEIKLELKHFSKKYGTNKIYAVKDANFEVHGGEIFGFLGPNGAGKSTIIKSIVGIQPITEGSIEICGFDVQNQSTFAKANIGYVPDHYALYEQLTGREYINYIADIFDVSIEDRNQRLEKYIKIFQLESSIDSKIRTYSHGMKQKITIMAALVHDPKVWILDEPLTGLDPTSIYQVKECMKQHAEAGNIVFFSSHIIDIVEKLCERIAIIKKGQIQCVKSVKEIEDEGYSLEQLYLDTIKDNDGESR